MRILLSYILIFVFGFYGFLAVEPGLVSAATNQGRIWSSGFELNSLTADMEIEATGGTGSQSIVTNPVRSGTYALRTNTTGSAVSWVRYRFAESNSSGPFYFRFYLRVADYPDANSTIVSLDSTGGADRIGLQMSTTGALKLMDLDGGATQVGSDSSALSLNTWYRVELKYDATGGLSAVSAEARLDGTSFASSSSITIASTVGRVNFGVFSAAANTDFYWDDLAINTSSFPGAGKIVHLAPNAAGDNASWTIGAGSGLNYQQVDETTPDDATTYLLDAGAAGTVTDDYNIGDAGSLIGSGTVALVQVGVRGGGTGTTARTFVTRIKSEPAGTVEESSSLDWSLNGWRTNHEGPNSHNYDLTLYDLPGASTSDWATSTIDSAQIGVRHDLASATEVRLSAIWLLVEYNEAGGSSGGGGDSGSSATSTTTGGRAESFITRFYGKAFPGGKISLFETSQLTGQVKTVSAIASEYGDFSLQLPWGARSGNYSYSLIIEDKDSRQSQIKSYNIDATTQLDRYIFAPPTLEFAQGAVVRGAPLIVTGYATPGKNVIIEIGGDDYKTSAKSDGSYKLAVDVGKLAIGSHSVRGKQQDDVTKEESEYSLIRNFNITKTPVFIDFNGDSNINISDWSIFLSTWGKAGEERNVIDLNKDGKIDISDLSLFLEAFNTNNNNGSL